MTALDRRRWPKSLGLGFYYVRPNYASNVWQAKVGADASAAGHAQRTATLGGPTFDYSAASGADISIGSGVSLTSLGITGAGDWWFFAVVDLLTISTNDTVNHYANASIIEDGPDAKRYLGLNLRYDASNTYALTYQYDGAVKKAEATAVAAATGRVVVQGKKESGSLYVKIGTGAWSAGTVVGAIGDLSGTIRLGARSDMTIVAAGGRNSAPSTAEADATALWGGFQG